MTVDTREASAAIATLPSSQQLRTWGRDLPEIERGNQKVFQCLNLTVSAEQVVVC